MGSLLKDHAHFLLLFITPSTPLRQKKVLVETIDKGQLNSISELAVNVLRGNLTLNERERGVLKRYKSNLRCLASRRQTLNARKQSLKVSIIEILVNICKEVIQEAL